MASERPSAAPARTNTGLSTASLGGGGKQCYICLQNEADDPAAAWVSACPCSLETHEDCMLHWIAEQEVQQGGAGGPKNIRCPACQAPINVDEPFDLVVSFRDRLHRAYSRVSPVILLSMFLSGAGAASMYYGVVAGEFFVGPRELFNWLGVRTLLLARRREPLWQWQPLWTFTMKMWLLSTLAPGIILTRALPGQMRTMLLPLASIHMGSLVMRNHMLTWPPSPEWTVTLFPFVNLIYTHIYYEWAGPLEKRLNRALRGLPPNEEPQQPAPRPAGQINAPNDQHQHAGVREDQGLWATVTQLWRVLFDDPPHEIEGELALEVRIGPVDEEEQEEEDDEAELIEAVEEALAEERAEEVANIEAPLADTLQREQGDQAPEQQEVERVYPAQEAPREPQAQAGRAQNNNRNNAAAAPAQGGGGGGANENRNNHAAAASTLTEIVNSLVTSLMYPMISYSLGELLRLTIPRQWVQHPYRGPPTALLQQRWGRSLLGGCMYVVLKDMFLLYTKYRRVQVKQHRKVRSVEKKAGRTNGITR